MLPHIKHIRSYNKRIEECTVCINARVNVADNLTTWNNICFITFMSFYTFSSVIHMCGDTTNVHTRIIIWVDSVLCECKVCAEWILWMENVFFKYFCRVFLFTMHHYKYSWGSWCCYLFFNKKWFNRNNVGAIHKLFKYNLPNRMHVFVVS